MATIEQKLSSNSLEALKRMASSKDARLKKKTKEILRNPETYPIILKEYEETHDELVDLLYSYGIIDQEETAQ